MATWLDDTVLDLALTEIKNEATEVGCSTRMPKETTGQPCQATR